MFEKQGESSGHPRTKVGRGIRSVHHGGDELGQVVPAERTAQNRLPTRDRCRYGGVTRLPASRSAAEAADWPAEAMHGRG